MATAVLAAVPRPVARGIVTTFPAARLTAFLLAHVVLGVLVFQWPSLATIHAWAALALGFWVVISGRSITDAGFVAAYVVGAEVLWRMRSAVLFWEMGKYAVAALLLIAITRHGRRVPTKAPAIYFVLLLPSVLVTLANTNGDLWLARDYVSFNLSGPFALAVCVYFFKQVTLNRKEFAKLAIATIGPIVAVATLTVLSTYTATELVFSARSSNAATSAGFGPNQVSALLGMGALLCFLILTTVPVARGSLALTVFAIFVVCAIQGAMTFSRTGPYLGSLACGAALLCFIGDRLLRVRGVVLVVAAALIFLLTWPVLDRFTSGAIVERYEDVEPTGRLELAQSDLAVFLQHPILGVGPGLGSAARAGISFEAAAHTEWTRTLSEHGLFGIASMAVLVTIMAGSFRAAEGPVARGLVLSLLVWSVGFLAVGAMRLSAPAFLIGVTCATFRGNIQVPQRSVSAIRTRTLIT